MNAYHDRFAEALRAELPEDFEINAEQWGLVAARYGTAALIAWTPYTEDKRRPVSRAEVLEWIETATANLRRDMYHYTPQAHDAANALMSALEIGRIPA